MDKKRLQKMQQELSRDEAGMQQELTKIYQNQDGSMPDISHLEIKRKSRGKLIVLSVVGIAALLTSVSWLGFLLFGGIGQSDAKSMQLEISAPQNIASGDEVDYILTYKNIEKVPLDDVEIIFRYPDGYSFTEADPAPKAEFNTVWTIGRLEQNQRGQITIKGKLIGEVGSLKTINVTASFRPENFSSTFKETAEATSQITNSTLDVSLEGPDKTLAEKEVTYTVKYHNTSSQDLQHVKIIANYPASFVFKDADPKPFSQADEARHLNNQWVIDSLGKNQAGEIKITGGYLADTTVTAADFSVQIGFFDPQTDEFSVQQEKKVTTNIVGQNLALNLIANGSNQDQPISFEQTLAYSIVYKNLGQADLNDVTIIANLDGDVLDWDSLDDKHGGTIKGNTITWTKDQIAELNQLRPLDEGTIDFTIQVKAANKINLAKATLQLKSKATATMVKIGELETPDATVESNQITNNISTDVDLKVEGRYFTTDNIPVGSGPLPPVVGQTTTFRIYWSIANSLHQVGDVTVSTVLPNGVSWANKFLANSGSLSYSNGDNKVTWTIASIAPNKSFDDTTAWFDVSVTPTTDQVKKILILTGQTTLDAIDKITNAPITKVGKAITSNLEDDPIGGGKGLVVDIAQ